jgi:hypothetical protein
VVAAEGAADGAADGGERGGRRGGGGIGGRHCPALSSSLVPRVCLLASLGGDWLPLALLCSLSLSLSLSSLLATTPYQQQAGRRLGCCCWLAAVLYSCRWNGIEWKCGGTRSEMAGPEVCLSACLLPD